MSNVQVLVDDEGNRDALASLVGQRYDVVDGSGVREADLYLVDDRSLPEYRDALMERKRDQQPAFCPVVLVRREDTRIRIELPDRSADGDPPIVDDIVSAPVDGPVLFRRLSNLLVRREQSLSLTEQFRQTEARFRGLFQSIPDPALVLDGSGAIVEVNEAFCRLTGVARDDVVDAYPSTLDGLPDGLATRLTELGEGTSPVVEADTGTDTDDSNGDGRTMSFSDADGVERHVEIRSRTETVGGEATTVVVFHDVTELTEKNQQLEEFASIVTHDLRNPMNVVKARVGIVDDIVGDEEASEHVSVAERSVERMEDLIEDVRTVVRGADVERTERVELSSVVRDA